LSFFSSPLVSSVRSSGFTIYEFSGCMQG
jgi:hypothetical protein